MCFWPRLLEHQPGFFSPPPPPAGRSLRPSAQCRISMYRHEWGRHVGKTPVWAVLAVQPKRRARPENSGADPPCSLPLSWQRLQSSGNSNRPRPVVPSICRHQAPFRPNLGSCRRGGEAPLPQCPPLAPREGGSVGTEEGKTAAMQTVDSPLSSRRPPSGRSQQRQENRRTDGVLFLA